MKFKLVLCAAALTAKSGSAEPVGPQSPIGQPAIKTTEIRLDGVVQAVNAKKHIVVLSVQKFTLPNGKSQTLRLAKPKQIVVAPKIWPRAAKLRRGQRVAFTGTDAGSGKPLNARLLWIPLGTPKPDEWLSAGNADAKKVAASLVEEMTTAATFGFDDDVRALLKKGADVNLANANGWTPLMFAAAMGKTATVKLLIDNKADANAAMPDGTTVLMHAAMHDKSEIVKLLLASGAKADVETPKGATALSYAENMGFEASAELLREALKTSAQPAPLAETTTEIVE